MQVLAGRYLIPQSTWLCVGMSKSVGEWVPITRNSGRGGYIFAGARPAARGNRPGTETRGHGAGNLRGLEHRLGRGARRLPKSAIMTILEAGPLGPCCLLPVLSTKLSCSEGLDQKLWPPLFRYPAPRAQAAGDWVSRASNCHWDHAPRLGEKVTVA